ncbi:MAG: hypothetical protein GY856_17120 [bacterium]|nr:hypothetical protein [bacterium]
MDVFVLPPLALAIRERDLGPRRAGARRRPSDAVKAVTVLALRSYSMP